MTIVPRDVTNDELLDVVRSWVDLMAAGDYGTAFARFGYSLAELPSDACLAEALRDYRSEKFFPGETDFRVTDWRTAAGGNPSPEEKVEWYESSGSLAGAISFDLPLNGKWSNLQADFVLYASEDPAGFILVLEEICHPSSQRDDRE